MRWSPSFRGPRVAATCVAFALNGDTPKIADSYNGESTTRHVFGTGIHVFERDGRVDGRLAPGPRSSLAKANACDAAVGSICQASTGKCAPAPAHEPPAAVHQPLAIASRASSSFTTRSGSPQQGDARCWMPDEDPR